jgi:2-methylisocitrate lyase-like PEP mutase family enzyme
LAIGFQTHQEKIMKLTIEMDPTADKDVFDRVMAALTGAAQTTNKASTAEAPVETPGVTTPDEKPEETPSREKPRVYGEAGADVLFVEAPESVEEMKTVCESLNKPLLANMVTGGKTPVLPGKELKALGYTIAIHPAAGFLSCAAGLDKAFQDLKEHGTVTEATPMYEFSEFTRMIGFPDVWAFEKRYAQD